MNIAHFFTFIRLLIIPLFPIFYLQYEKMGISPLWVPYILLFILLLCESTDLLDGYFARRKNQVTDIGKIIDPMSDSITRMLVFFTFTQGWVQVPLILVFVFLYREFLISSLRTICALKGFALGARKSGKIKAIIQAAVNIFVVILLIPFTLGYLPLSWLQNMSFYAVLFAAIYSVISAVDYVISNKEYVRRIFVTTKEQA
ncbi:MAG: CDP-alcohol phosphatidyltransferase family protein [Chlamydiota bacterium]